MGEHHTNNITPTLSLYDLPCTRSKDVHMYPGACWKETEYSIVKRSTREIYGKEGGMDGWRVYPVRKVQLWILVMKLLANTRGCK